VAVATAFLLDLTRLVSRASIVPTGVDRVERAYLDRLLGAPVPVLGLVRTAYGFALLDQAGLTGLQQRLSGKVSWGAVDTLSGMRRGLSEPRKRAEADMRRLAMARCLPARLTRMLSKHVPDGAVYLNVGHSNLTDRVLTAVRVGAKARIAVMIHDTIPMDFPQFQRPGMADRFSHMLRRVRARADWIIVNSQATARDVQRIMAPWGELPPVIVAHLGVDTPRPLSAWPQPGGFDKDRPYFVTVGTIEPRKNHGFLLDLWAALLGDGVTPLPQLLICGRRGWNNQAVFDRLDTDPMMGRDVFELPDLDDGAVAAALDGSQGLLFPSLAEGYGLPPLEAAALGVRVICNDLAVYRETLGDIPVYASCDAIYLWQKTIMAILNGNVETTKGRAVDVPGWDAHFNTVLSRLV
jgi:glycosyltransferase involved in cell wall biosynthesis